MLGLKPSLEFCCSGGVVRIRENIEKDRETCEIFKVEHPSTVIRRIIAENIKEKGSDSIFMSNAVIALIPEQVVAARFLVKYGIV